MGFLKSIGEEPPDDYQLFQSDSEGHHLEWTTSKTFNQSGTGVALVEVNKVR